MADLAGLGLASGQGAWFGAGRDQTDWRAAGCHECAMRAGRVARLPGLFCCRNAAFFKGGLKGRCNLSPSGKSIKNIYLRDKLEAGTGIEPVFTDLQSAA